MLKNKRALITGSTAGIGLGIADVLLKHGASVIINGTRDEEAVKETLANLMKKYPESSIQYIRADLSKIEDCENLIKKSISLFGGLDILVNNAGIQFVSSVSEFPIDQWNRLMAINLTAPFILSKALVNHWKLEEKKNQTPIPYGRIINISSVHGLVASVHKSAYVASKHGLNGFTKVLALELAETNVTVNSICPGYIDTELVRKQIKDFQKENKIESEEEATKKFVEQKQPTKRFTTCEQIGEMVAFLCSNAASNMTGSMQVMDGAWIVG